MPDDETLARMYGTDYETSFADDPAIADPKEPQRVIEWLRRNERGTFVDYGCGAGALLAEAVRLNWKAVGVEFDDEVARVVARRTGTEVLSLRAAELLPEPIADVLHLGDVIEHLTRVNQQMPRILRLIKPGGLLLAQGPLEANANLFTATVRVVRRLRPAPRTEMAPYHVMLATAEGQRILFQRFGIEEIEYSIGETAWPAPDNLRLLDLKRPRAVGLFALRRVSQAISRLRPAKWGNRYFFVGRWNG
jgi:SAM-dependent methyltransferase